MRSASVLPVAAAIALLPFAAVAARSQAASQPPARPQQVIIDTDIGDDIDDAFAVALALRSPELHILGITTAFGDTELRARLLDRIMISARSCLSAACEARADSAGFLRVLKPAPPSGLSFSAAC